MNTYNNFILLAALIAFCISGKNRTSNDNDASVVEWYYNFRYVS